MASLIELRAPTLARARAQATLQMPPGDSLCIYQQLGAGSRFSGNPEFCIHHGMFATSLFGPALRNRPAHRRRLSPADPQGPRSGPAPSQADLVKARLGDLVPKPFSEHGALVPLLASCFRDLKETDEAREPERARSLVQALAQLALIERGVIRPGSRAALHAASRRPPVAGPAIDCSQHLAGRLSPAL